MCHSDPGAGDSRAFRQESWSDKEAEEQFWIILRQQAAVRAALQKASEILRLTEVSSKPQLMILKHLEQVQKEELVARRIDQMFPLTPCTE